MRSRNALVGMALFAVVVTWAGTSGPAIGQQAQPIGVIEGLQPMTGAATVVVLRQVNSLQARAAQVGGGFASIATVIQSGLPHVNGESWWQVDPHSARAGRVTLRLMVAEDGKAYSVSAHEEGTCSTSAFSDERGVIYQGQALGCDTIR